MLELRVAVDKECAECLVYQHQESALRGKLHIKSSDRLKLRQITIRLVSTELVDIHHSSSDDVVDEGAATGTGFLQKSTKTVGTWVVLAKGGESHVLAAGEHQYSFEIALPRGLDGTVDTGAYRLGYELESRVEHSFVLKPATALLTPVTLVQVPMGLNLHSDDRVSMNIVAAPSSSRLTAPEDVPLGRAVCVHADAIDQGRAFVLRHLWDAAIAVRLRLPRGRVFATDAHAVVDVQAVPITRDYRCTSVTLRLEEIAIIARPQRSSTPSVVSGPAARHGSVSGSAAAARRSSSVAVSSSSEDSVVLRAAGDSSAAAALAQECSAEYRNAITRVRTLATSTHTAWPDRPNVSLAEFSGIAAARLRLHVSPTTYGATHTHAHTDIRNSHIQVHHQIAYEVRYERIAEHHPRDSAAGPDARILAVARVYSALGSANIVRRDELKETGGSSGGFRVVRGTLPVAIVPKKISALWGLKNAPYDDDDDTDVGYEDGDIGLPGADPAAASFPAQHNDSHLSGLQVGAPPVSISVSAPSPAYVPSPAMLGMMHGGGNNSIGMPGTTNTPTVPGMPGIPNIPGVSGMPSFPGMPAMMPGMTGFPGMPTMPGMPSFPSAYPSAAPAAQPMGFNPMMMPQAHGPGYPMDNGYGANMPGFNSYDSSSGGGSMPYGGGMGGSNTPAYNPTALQQQIQMFQEQQRMQQQQFFQQLSEQYGQMVVSPHSPSPSPAVSNHYQPHVSSSSSLGSAYNTYGPAPPPPPPQPPVVVAQEQVAVYNNGPTVATDESLHADLMTTIASETATASSEPSASEDSQPARPDSAAADIDNNTPFVDAVEHSADAVEPSNRDTEPEETVRPSPAPVASQPLSPSAFVAVVAAAVEQQPVQQSSTTAAASNTSSESDVPAVSAGRHSPPPNYDELLPPEYEVPANQPPPYRPLESNRSRRRMWDI
ncbi:hypothetical protein GGF42_001475 [Coemansia sp. RSA 2424]|nr:hypothetical protein GGF42_001475 [Coemansia sp. RSA 2424]